MNKTNYYNEYKKSELYTIISGSDFTEYEYNELKQELESAYIAISRESEQPTEYELVDGADEMLRYAIKHLCRLYPTFGVSLYKVKGTSHTNVQDVVTHTVDATHEEQAKFYFHTKYSHRQYRVTEVEKATVDNKMSVV